MKRIGTTDNGVLIEIATDELTKIADAVEVLEQLGQQTPLFKGPGAGMPEDYNAMDKHGLTRAEVVAKLKAAAPAAAKPAKAKPAPAIEPKELPPARKFVREPRMGTCTICGKEFVKKVPVQKCCSDACTLEKNLRYARERAKKNYVPKKAAKPGAVAKAKPGYSMAKCIICGKDFERKSPIQKCCSAECVAEKNRRYQKDYNANMAAQAAPKPSVKPLRVVTGEIDGRVTAAVAEARESENLN
jgi:hypothetical protein